MSLIISIREIIINEVKSGCCFDSHLIIQVLNEKYSKEYFQHISSYSSSANITLTAHQQIGHLIADLEKEGIVQQLDCKSWSFNIHHNQSECTLFKKL